MDKMNAQGVIVAARSRASVLWFFGRVQQQGSCWRWVGLADSKGYARMHIRGKSHARVARVAHIWFRGLIADGLEIDHLCENRLCVNPLHLEAVSHLENMRRWSLRRVACRNGHPLTQVRIVGDGRHCMVCLRDSQHRGQKAYRDRRRNRSRSAVSP